MAGLDGDGSGEGGCAFIGEGARPCGAPPQPRSAYCPDHHALCHLAGGTRAERRRLQEEEALARVVGGRRSRSGREPPERFLRRVERVTHDFLRHDCSCYVPEGEG